MTIGQRLPNGLVVRGINQNETEYLYKEIFEDRIYMPPGTDELPERPVIVDVGANIGMFTIFAAHTWPQARIYAFEPAPDVFEVLCQNVAHLPNVTVVKQALGAVAEQRQLTYYPQYTMMSGFDADPAADKALVHSYIQGLAATFEDEVRREVFLEEAKDLLTGRFDERRTMPCEVVRLDSASHDLGIHRIDLLKIDVEGFETEVIEGIGEPLWAYIHRVAVEVEDDHGELARITALFADRGLYTTVTQAPEYSGTSLHTLFATRRPPAGAAERSPRSSDRKDQAQNP